MALDERIMTLDERIRQDLTQIYENKIMPLSEIMAIVNRYKDFKLGIVVYY